MRKFGPMSKDHPAVKDGEKCPGCRKAIVEGDYVTLVPVGPGDDPEARKAAAAGRPYNAVAVIAHWDCSGVKYDGPSYGQGSV